MGITPLPVKPPTKINVTIPIFLSILVSAVLFGSGGYYLGKQSSIPLQDFSPQSANNSIVSEDKNTYVDQKNNFSFDYPSNVKPLELANGVVSFLPENAYDACESAQGSNDIQIFEPCSNALFNLNGFEVNPMENYAEYSNNNKDVAVLSTYTDSQGRTWNTGLVLGQVYNFDSFGIINNKSVKISFQYGFNAPSEEKVISFFEEILSTFKFTNEQNS